MSDSYTILQFQSPWQGRAGFSRYHVNKTTGELTAAKNAKTKRLLRKGQKGIEGLVLFPTWPTQNGLIVTPCEQGLQLRKINKGRLDIHAAPIETSAPEFQSQISERLLYRKFSFSDGPRTLVFSDLSARLMTSPRTAYEVFPTPDFSPFARLSAIINHDQSHQKLVADLNNGRFDYPSWSDNSAHAERYEFAMTAVG